MTTATKVKCNLCNVLKRSDGGLPLELLPSSIHDLAKQANPAINDQDFICFNDINILRTKYVEGLLSEERGELTSLEESVLESLREQDLLSENLNKEFDENKTFGERLSDKIADFGGSWKFIIIFSAILVLWITINSLIMVQKPFDPYPYILLNLVLSSLAAVQAPFIMMSQNRQEAKDRLRSESDYRINLKAELEIRHIKARLDQLLSHQWNRLMEIQKIQLEMMQELSKKK